jgi:hypothetical protein
MNIDNAIITSYDNEEGAAIRKISYRGRRLDLAFGLDRPNLVHR